MRSLRVVIFAVGGLLWLAVTGAWAAEYTFSYQKIIDIEQPVVLHLSLVRGSVYISGSEDDRLVIEAVKRVRATDEDEAEEVADQALVLAERARGGVRFIRIGRLPNFPAS